MNNIYESIMKAADQIEKYPDSFKYEYPRILGGGGCGSVGCAFGWIAHFAGELPGDTQKCLNERAPMVLGVPYWASVEESFESRMTDLRWDWQKNAQSCAMALRMYAERYHKPSVVLRSDKELVEALVKKITTERIPEDA